MRKPTREERQQAKREVEAYLVDIRQQLSQQAREKFDRINSLPEPDRRYELAFLILAIEFEKAGRKLKK